MIEFLLAGGTPETPDGPVPWQQGKKEKGAAKRRRPSICD
jgi:hypothetical protein